MNRNDYYNRLRSIINVSNNDTSNSTNDCHCDKSFDKLITVDNARTHTVSVAPLRYSDFPTVRRYPRDSIRHRIYRKTEISTPTRLGDERPHSLPKYLLRTHNSNRSIRFDEHLISTSPNDLSLSTLKIMPVSVFELQSSCRRIDVPPRKPQRMVSG
jgi:hypothetical protein